MADPEQGVPAPNLPPAPAPAPQAQQVPQAPQGQQLVHLNWSYFNQNFQENLMRHRTTSALYQ